MHAGTEFKPGEGIVKPDKIENTEVANKFLSGEISDFDNSFIATIKSSGMLAAIKVVKERRSIDLSAAKAVVERIAREHNITPATPRGDVQVL